MPHRLVMVLAVGSTVIGGILALSGPPVYVSGTPGLASITGGGIGGSIAGGLGGLMYQEPPRSMHQSATFIALQLVLVHEYYRASMPSGRTAWTTILFALPILIGYGGRMIFIGAYFASLGYFRFRDVVAEAQRNDGRDDEQDERDRGDHLTAGTP